MRGFVIPYITDYLLGEVKVMDAEIAKEVGRRSARSFIRQFQENREVKVGGYGAGRVSKPICQSWHYHLGKPSEPFDVPTLMKFYTGDLIETGLHGVIAMAFKDTPHSIGCSNEFVSVPIGTGDLSKKEDEEGAKAHIHGYIDDLISFNHEYHIERFKEDLRPPWDPKCETEDLVVEYKSVPAYPYKLFVAKPGFDDLFGYVGQPNAYCRALRIRRYLWVIQEKDKGYLAESVGTNDKPFMAKCDQKYDDVMRYAQAEPPVLPPVPSECQPIEGNRGTKLTILCDYCSYKTQCWEARGYTLEFVMEKGYKGAPKPAWYLRSGTKKVDTPLFDQLENSLEEEVNSESTHSRGS